MLYLEMHASRSSFHKHSNQDPKYPSAKRRDKEIMIQYNMRSWPICTMMDKHIKIQKEKLWLHLGFYLIDKTVENSQLNLENQSKDLPNKA
jgi:hypothetical protein